MCGQCVDGAAAEALPGKSSILRRCPTTCVAWHAYPLVFRAGSRSRATNVTAIIVRPNDAGVAFRCPTHATKRSQVPRSERAPIGTASPRLVHIVRHARTRTPSLRNYGQASASAQPRAHRASLFGPSSATRALHNHAHQHTDGLSQACRAPDMHTRQELIDAGCDSSSRTTPASGDRS